MDTILTQFFVVVIIQSLIPIFLKKYNFNRYMASFCGAVLAIIFSILWNEYEGMKKGKKFSLMDEVDEISSKTSPEILLLSVWSWIKDIIRLFFYSKMSASFVKGSSCIMTVSAFLADSYLLNNTLTPIQMMCVAILTVSSGYWSFIREKKNKNKNIVMLIAALFLTRVIDGIVVVKKKKFIDTMSTQSFSILSSLVFLLLNIVALTYNKQWNTFTWETFFYYGVLGTIVFLAQSFYRKKISNTTFLSMVSLSPAIVALFSRFILKEQLRRVEWFIIFIIMASVFMIQKIDSDKKAKKKAETENSQKN